MAQTAVAVHRRFLTAALERDDYPSQCGFYDPLSSDDPASSAMATAVLKARKGDAYSYSALFIHQCANADELPATIREVLLHIDTALKPKKAGPCVAEPDICPL